MKRISRSILCLFVMSGVLTPGPGLAAPEVGTFFTLKTRGIAVMRSGVPYKFSLQVDRQVTKSTGDETTLILTFERKKANGAKQTHLWGWKVDSSSFGVGKYPNVFIDTPLAGGHGFVDMKFVMESTSESCENTVNFSRGVLVKRGSEGGLSFDSKNAFFDDIQVMRFESATLRRELPGCVPPTPPKCPRAFRSANAFGTMPNGKSVTFGGTYYPSRDRGSLYGEIAGSSGLELGGPPILVHRASAPVPALYATVAEDLSSATFAGKNGTFFSGIVSLSSTATPTGNDMGTCGEGRHPVFYSVPASAVDGDMTIAFDGFPDPSAEFVSTGIFQKVDFSVGG